MTTVLFASFLVLLLLDVPVVYCMMLSSLAALLYAGIDPIMVGLEMSRAMSSFYPFLAVPFFILAGDLMNQGGLSERIVDFSKAIIGHRRGGLAMVTTLSAQMFGAISGASSATCAAIGSMMIPAMERQGYPRPFATALAACSGVTGALIPPSIVLLIYGVIAGVSVEKLFLAGVGPGILLGAGLMLVSWSMAGNFTDRLEPRAGLKAVIRSGSRAVFVFLLLLIIFGGILGGVFTATEAAAVAVVYALVVGMAIYRQLRLCDLPQIFIGAGKTTAGLSFLICAAGLFSWTLTIGYVPQTLAQGLLGICDRAVVAVACDLSPESVFIVKKILVLLVLNIALLVVGMFVDAGPALLIVTPVLLPVGLELGIDPVHFGVIVVCNLIIGLVTPPVGTTLYVASSVGRVRIATMIPYVLRFLVVMIGVQLLVTFVPAISMFLPSFLK